MVDSEVNQLFSRRDFVAGEADASRTCKDDDLPFCAFLVHEQFIVGDDGGHGGIRSQVQEQKEDNKSCGLAAGVTCGVYLGCVREICHASRYQPKTFLLEILPRARYCAVREIFCLRETESRSGNISPNSCQTGFLLEPQTPPDCVTICDPACYLCDANVTKHAPNPKVVQ